MEKKFKILKLIGNETTLKELQHFLANYQRRNHLILPGQNVRSNIRRDEQPTEFPKLPVLVHVREDRGTCCACRGGRRLRSCCDSIGLPSEVVPSDDDPM